MLLYLCRDVLRHWYRAICLYITLFALLVLKTMSCWVFLIIITLSVSCNSSVIWKVRDVLTSLEGRRRRWPSYPRQRKPSGVFKIIFFQNFHFATSFYIIILLHYVNTYQVTSHKIQANVRRHGIAGWNLSEF